MLSTMKITKVNELKNKVIAEVTSGLLLVSSPASQENASGTARSQHGSQFWFIMNKFYKNNFLGWGGGGGGGGGLGQIT